jgi:hypothetical protein
MRKVNREAMTKKIDSEIKASMLRRLDNIEFVLAHCELMRTRTPWWPVHKPELDRVEDLLAQWRAKPLVSP